VENRARRGLQLVSTVVRTFSQQTSNYEALLQTIARAIAEALPDTCFVSLCSEDCATIGPVAIHDTDDKVVASLERFRKLYPMSEAPFAAQAIDQGPVLQSVADVRGGVLGEILTTLGGRGFVIVPMRAAGQLYGVISIIRRRAEHEPLDALDVEILEDLAGHAALAISNARMFAKLSNEARLREATQFLDAIVENIPDMVFVKEADRLTFVRFNRAGEQLLGVGREGLIGKNDYDFFPQSEADFFTQKDRETLRNKQLVDIPEEPIHTAAGTRWLHTKKVPLVDDAGTPRYLLGISHDITERKRADAALRLAKETLENANKELEGFAYSIAHDLRAPLRAILGYSTAVLEDASAALDTQSQDYLRRMHEAAKRMAMLIDDLLGLARVSQADLVRSRVDLTATALSVAAGFEAAHKDRAVEVVIQPELVAEADPHLIATALENLLDNAWKFTAKKPSAKIEIGKQDNAFFVRDNGAGFDMKYADQLFGVFRRLHQHEEFPGTGIGLATVARIIHRHHGRVWAEGKVGEGATFYFTLGESI